LAQRQILREGGSSPLDLDSLAAMTGADLSKSGDANILAVILDALEQARLGTVESVKSLGIHGPHLSISTLGLGFSPFPFLISMVFFMVLIYLLTKRLRARQRL